MKVIYLPLLGFVLSSPVMAADFCRHEDAAEVLDQFFFSTQTGTEDLLEFIGAENARHAEIENLTALAAQGGKSAEATLLHQQVQAKRRLSLHIEEELRCRLGPAS